MADVSRDQVVDFLSNLPVIQLAELIKELENKWGVKAAPAAVAVAAGPAAPAAVVEEQTEFNVILTSSGEKKSASSPFTPSCITSRTGFVSLATIAATMGNLWQAMRSFQVRPCSATSTPTIGTSR